MSFDAMAEDVLNTMDSLGIESASLLGHSLGGKVAMAAAFKSPERVEKLCVLDMAPAAYSVADGSQWKTNRSLIEALHGLKLKELKDRRDADAKLAQSVLDPNIRAFALSNLQQDPNTKELSWKCHLDAILQNLDYLATWDNNEHTYNGPTLFLAGSHSRYIRSVHLPTIERSFPNFALRTVPNAGHWLHAEAPKPTQNFAQEFLDFTHHP